MKVAMQQDLINKIENSVKIEDVLDIHNFKDEFNAIIKQIHPDICSLSGAGDAVSKMNSWKLKMENGELFKDDVGEFTTNGYWVKYKDVTNPMIKWSFENYMNFMGLSTSADKQFQKYLPLSMELSSDELTINFDKRAIPLSSIDTLPQEHVNWVLNRLFEYCSYLDSIGWVHCGLTPDNVFNVPETHGIQITSFYHLTRKGRKIKTISGKYSNWYPQSVFNDKQAINLIDIEMSKKIAIWLLGDKSGVGIKLKKTHNENFINFVSKHNTIPFETMNEYKTLLKANWKSEFHNLNI